MASKSGLLEALRQQHALLGAPMSIDAAVEAFGYSRTHTRKALQRLKYERQAAELKAKVPATPVR